jgi:hypothetical protein
MKGFVVCFFTFAFASNVVDFDGIPNNSTLAACDQNT